MIAICFRISGLFALILLMTLFGYTHADVSPGGGGIDCSYQKAHEKPCPGAITQLPCHENYSEFGRCDGYYQTDIMVNLFGCTSTLLPSNCNAKFDNILGDKVSVTGYCTKTYDCHYYLNTKSCNKCSYASAMTKAGLFETVPCSP